MALGREWACKEAGKPTKRGVGRGWSRRKESVKDWLEKGKGGKVQGEVSKDQEYQD